MKRGYIKIGLNYAHTYQSHIIEYHISTFLNYLKDKKTLMSNEIA